MRRALGLRDTSPSNNTNQQPRPTGSMRHEVDRRARRFVRDGEVPVVVLGRGRDHPAPSTARPDTSDAIIQLERAARERAERALQEAQVTIQHLQTQLGHADLAHREALETERVAREHAEAARTAAEAARERAEAARERAEVAREHSERALQQAQAAQNRLEQRLTDLTRIERSAAPVPPPAPAETRPTRSMTKPGKSASAQRPVEWWLPTFKPRGRRS